MEVRRRYHGGNLGHVRLAPTDASSGAIGLTLSSLLVPCHPAALMGFVLPPGLETPETSR